MTRRHSRAFATATERSPIPVILYDIPGQSRHHTLHFSLAPVTPGPPRAWLLAAGCDTWYSVIGGTLPVPALRITDAAREGRHSDALAESDRLESLWQLFAEYGGSLRVVAALAEELGLARASCLPRPLQGLTAVQRASVRRVISDVGLRS